MLNITDLYSVASQRLIYLLPVFQLSTSRDNVSEDHIMYPVGEACWQCFPVELSGLDMPLIYLLLHSCVVGNIMLARNMCYKTSAVLQLVKLQRAVSNSP